MISELELLRDIAARLSNGEPIDNEGICTLCEASTYAGQQHSPECAWQMARDWEIHRP